MNVLGLVLLVAVAIAVPLTGVPAFLVLIAAAIVGATAGVASDAIPMSLLAALPARLVNLLENDLLQALPLYVLVGALLNRLPIADSLFRFAVRLMRRRASAPAVAGLALGALLGPMNGSVGASVVALSRTVAPRLAASGVAAPRQHALVAVASTLGIVVPPSLVLILLADGMLTAHTIAVTAAHRTDRIVNTQDLFRGALVPAALFLAIAVAVAVWQSRGRSTDAKELRVPEHRADTAVAVVALLFIVGLLAGVAAGRFYAVEGAAAAAFVLFVAAVVTGRLRGSGLPALLTDVMATTGALFALLVAATTFTLVFRALGTDILLADWLTGADLPPPALTLIVLAAIGLSALALDAFEIIFVLVPVLMPPLLTRVPDASWVGVLVLLALQSSFLIPPLGYALLMTRGVMQEQVGTRALMRNVVPYLAGQLVVLGAVLAFPALVHLAQPDERPGASDAPTMSDEEAARRMHEMLVQPPEVDDRAGSVDSK